MCYAPIESIKDVTASSGVGEMNHLEAIGKIEFKRHFASNVSKKPSIEGCAHTIFKLIHRFRLEHRHGTKNRSWKPAQKNWE